MQDHYDVSGVVSQCAKNKMNNISQKSHEDLFAIEENTNIIYIYMCSDYKC